MDKKRLLLYMMLVAAIAAVAAYVLLIWFPGDPGDWSGGDTVVRPVPPERQERLAVYLYFAGPDGGVLVPEKRVIDTAAEPVALAKRIIAGLIKGPVDDNLTRTMPVDTVCRALYITDDTVAYVDFSSAITEDHPGGSAAERLTIYSIVNSLVMNVDGVKQVKILINGREAETLAGHIDLRFPFTANMRMVR